MIHNKIDSPAKMWIQLDECCSCWEANGSQKKIYFFTFGWFPHQYFMVSVLRSTRAQL